jgi:hypothetical protein
MDGRRASSKGATSRRSKGALELGLDTPESEMPPPTPFQISKPQPQESRRKSFMPPISDLRTSKSFQEALSRPLRRESDHFDSVEPGEEFAPSAEVDEIPARVRRRSGQIKRSQPKAFGDDVSDKQLFFWCLLVILSGFYFMFWRQEKFLVGFCGVPQLERILF